MERSYQEGDTLNSLKQDLYSSLVTNSAEEVNKVQLIWDDIHYETKVDKKPIEILKGVSGYANPGEFLAIMGSSGAGKTTLLNIIAGRIKSSKNSNIRGTVKANGINVKTINFNKLMAYITQEDILLPTLTIREAFNFSAQLRCPGSKFQINEKVEKMISDLKLEKVCDNVIGSILKKGISGGERKRASIGIELISEPSIVILDEPTSGLDSFTAEILIDLLINQANQGRTIISTIHQPSTSIFNKFDRLILLSEGLTVYQGKTKVSRKYFSKLGYKCPNNINPADFYLRMLHVSNRFELTQEESEKISRLIDLYSKLEKKIDDTDCFKAPIEYNKTGDLSLLSKMSLLFKRSWINASRNPLLTKVRMVMILFNGTLIDLVFHDLGNNYHSIQNINGVFSIVLMNLLFTSAMSYSLTFPAERPIFIKEYSQGLYGSFIYFMAKNVSELPMQLFAPLVYSLLIYFPLGLNLTVGKFFIFYSLICLNTLSGSGIGYLVGACVESEILAAAFAPLLPCIFLIFGGILGNLDTMNEAFSWMQYLSPVSWAFKSITINQYTDFHMDCGDIKCDPLGMLGFHDPLWEDVICLLGFVIAIRVIAYFALVMFARKYIK